MDLAAEAERLRLDLLAVELSRAFEDSGIPYVLIKGPSTSNWLYKPPRRYRDVDLLVPHSRLAEAAAVLDTAGLARAVAGAVGEEAEHSLLLVSPAGFEVDLHRSLPALPIRQARRDILWRALARHVEPLVLDVGTVRALDEPARCLVLALHALGGPGSADQPAEDLRRARAVAKPQSWQNAAQLAAELGVLDLFHAGLARVEALPSGTTLTARARLHLESAPSVAFGIQRIAEAEPRDLPRILWRELLPTRGFMQHAADVEITGGLSLARAHLHRWRALARAMPEGVRRWRATGRPGGG